VNKHHCGCCKWIPEGNGHYSTECGYLVYDKGRYNEMMNKTYNANKPEIAKIKICPKCKRKVET